MLNPEHGLLALDEVGALDDAAGALQEPNLIRALFPAVGRFGRNDDRIGLTAGGQLDVASRRRGAEPDENRRNETEDRGCKCR